MAIHSSENGIGKKPLGTGEPKLGQTRCVAMELIETE